ncbi:ABC transporter substrate-binding protein [Cereibacter changlensis]|uniref:ABC transporter substrate-binding protein n=1 Tax=Cereibacter changlensis TaxID=402884 RepID=A0A4U0YZU2_9RHOB|nr:ABC transporter substrate-binding protein [Cereibacter changlensis]TKA98460.1 ABC transporter substrate-binding protein [Cereibacter changlensis]
MKRRTVLKGIFATAGATMGMNATYLRAQSGPIRVGAAFALSGVGAPVGTPMLAGAEVAATQINRAGGLLGREIELVIRDDKYNSAESVAVARELAGDGINLLLGGSQTVTALGLAPLAPELNMAVVIVAAAGMPVTHELFNKNIFRATANNYTQYSSLGRTLIEQNPGIKTWISLAPDGDFGRDSALFFGRAVEKYGPGEKPTVLDTIYTQATATDFRTQINQLMSSDAEGLYIGIAASAQISFFQQARGVGLYDKFKAIGEVGNGDITGKALGRNTHPNLWSVCHWIPDAEPFASNAVSQQLYKDYVELKGDPMPSAQVAAGHRAANAIFEGIRAAGSTETEAVVAAMETLSFETAGGAFSFRAEDHQIVGPNYYSQMGPSDTEPFFKFSKVTGIEASEMIEPAAPGKAFDINELPQ